MNSFFTEAVPCNHLKVTVLEFVDATCSACGISCRCPEGDAPFCFPCLDRQRKAEARAELQAILDECPVQLNMTVCRNKQGDGPQGVVVKRVPQKKWSNSKKKWIGVVHCTVAWKKSLTGFGRIGSGSSSITTRVLASSLYEVRGG